MEDATIKTYTDEVLVLRWLISTLGFDPNVHAPQTVDDWKSTIDAGLFSMRDIAKAEGRHPYNEDCVAVAHLVERWRRETGERHQPKPSELALHFASTVPDAPR